MPKTSETVFGKTANVVDLDLYDPNKHQQLLRQLQPKLVCNCFIQF